MYTGAGPLFWGHIHVIGGMHLATNLRPSVAHGRTKWRHSVCTNCCITVSSQFGYSEPNGYEIFAPDDSFTDTGITMVLSELTTLISPFIVAITFLLGAFTIAGCIQKEQ